MDSETINEPVGSEDSGQRPKLHVRQFPLVLPYFPLVNVDVGFYILAFLFKTLVFIKIADIRHTRFCSMLVMSQILFIYDKTPERLHIHMKERCTLTCKISTLLPVFT